MDRMTKKERSAHMAKIKSRRTKPEMLVHGHLKGNHVAHEMWPDLYGHPDARIGVRTLLFVNGCFWHGCEYHFKLPSTNAAFWRAKIRRNRERQDEVVRHLRADGWRVLVAWEHQLKRANMAAFIARLVRKP